jgi:hypothetical protein
MQCITCCATNLSPCFVERPAGVWESKYGTAHRAMDVEGFVHNCTSHKILAVVSSGFHAPSMYCASPHSLCRHVGTGCIGLLHWFCRTVVVCRADAFSIVQYAPQAQPAPVAQYPPGRPDQQQPYREGPPSRYEERPLEVCLPQTQCRGSSSVCHGAISCLTFTT